MTVGIGATRLTDLLSSCAQQTPDAPALEQSDGKTLTFAELDSAATRLAHRLHRAGVKRGDRVGICMPKSINSVICVHGILKAGAAYVPVDYSSPPERNQYIFRNCQTRAICCDEPRSEQFRNDDFADTELLIFTGEATEHVGAPWMTEYSADWTCDDPADEDDLSYILYTSGSTGMPKGVMHTHGSATSFVNWAAQTIEPTANDRFSSHAPLHFDLSILDLYTPYTVGATIVLVDEPLGKEPARLAEFIAEKQINVWYSVPSILALMAQYGRLDQYDYTALRTVCFAGEVFPIKHLRDLHAQWPGRAYFNLYGPTETNVCTYYELPNEIEPSRETPYPIGPACSNVRSLVLDADKQRVTDGGEGVLYIHQSGPTMTGYWADPERTEASFHTDAEGERWYCTGDVVATDDEGNYIYMGRRDRMVKRHGYRIELGEIEAGLYKHSDIEEAAAIAVESEEGVTITVFLSTKSGGKLSIIALKQFCNRHLPTYMSPDRFVTLEHLPRTSTDKVDYQTLTKQASGG